MNYCDLDLTDWQNAYWGQNLARPKQIKSAFDPDNVFRHAQSAPLAQRASVGAKRDPEWGTVLLLGLGGIWVEALGDVQLVPGNADETQILEALGKLRSAKLLAGVRGAPPVDVDAVVQAVMAIGRLMQTVPELTEIDINPLMVHAKGQGATALDALIVAE